MYLFFGNRGGLKKLPSHSDSTVTGWFLDPRLGSIHFRTWKWMLGIRGRFGSAQHIFGYASGWHLKEGCEFVTHVWHVHLDLLANYSDQFSKMPEKVIPKGSLVRDTPPKILLNSGFENYGNLLFMAFQLNLFGDINDSKSSTPILCCAVKLESSCITRRKW